MGGYQHCPWIQGQTDAGACLVCISARMQLSYKEYKPWKWDPNERSCLSHTCNQHRGPQQDPACQRVPWPPDYSEETETEVVQTCHPIIQPVKTILQGTVRTARRQRKGSGGKTMSRVDRTGLSRVTEGRRQKTDWWRQLDVRSSGVPLQPFFKGQIDTCM